MDEEALKYFKGMLYLLAHSLPEGSPKPELLLAKAGFGHKEISAILGKSHAAVAKAVSRSKGAKSKGDDDE